MNTTPISPASIAEKVSAASRLLAEAYADMVAVQPQTLKEQRALLAAMQGIGQAQLKTEKQIRRLRSL